MANLRAIGETFGWLPSDLMKRDLEELMFDAEIMARSQALMDGKSSKRFDPKDWAARTAAVKAEMDAKRAAKRGE